MIPITHPPRDPAISALVRQASSALSLLATNARRVQEAIAAGSHRQLIDTGGSDPQVLRQIVHRLCNDDQFQHALPIALCLCARPDMTAHDAFLAGTCLQRLQRPAEALPFFAHAVLLDADGPTPGAMFRLGECLSATGDTATALASFSTAAELARESASHADLQQLAQARADALRAAY